MQSVTPHQAPLGNFNHLLILFSILIVIYALLFSWQSWNEEKNSRVQDLSTITEMGEKSIDNYFLQLHADLKNLAQNWADAGEALDLQRAYKDVKRYRDLRPELINLTVYREDGQILLSAKHPPTDKLNNLSKEAFFQEYIARAKEGAEFTIGRPVFGTTSKVWLIPSRLRVMGADGSLQYVISASLPVEFLQKFWRDAPITDRSSLGLVGDDGFILSRYPVPPNIAPHEVYGKVRTGTLMTYLRNHQFPSFGVHEGTSSLQGPNILSVYRRLTHYPITLFVVTPISDIRLEWWNKVKVPYFLTLILLMSALAAYLISMRRRRIWQREQERVDKLKAEFISVVSHELRTPITSVRGSLGLLEGGAVGPLPESAMKLIRIAHKNSQRLSNLVNDILDMEKLMLGKTSLKIERLDLLALVQSTIEANLGYAQGLEVSYLLLTHPPQCHVHADSERLTQVLTNLLSNAAKFSPAGSQVQIRILTQDGKYRIEVTDQGKGIPEKFRDHIFAPFSQADSTDSRQQSGTGLGLHISKTLIERMNGEIGFHSTEGHGSTFWFILDIA